MYGICTLSLVPIRKTPADSSEMTSQLLFGERVTVLEKANNWLRIRCEHDEYEGWVDKKQITLIDEKEWTFAGNNSNNFCSDISAILKTEKSNLINIVYGSTLPGIKNKKLNINSKTYSIKGNIEKINKKPSRKGILNVAINYLNSPYLWGGRSPFGIDCSGFVQMAFKLNGIYLPRDAWQQAEIGKILNFIEEANAGDLAFFDNQEGKIIHVGIILDKNKIIHASGKVKIDSIDHFGIFNPEIGDYSHKLRVIKTII
jgi:gamma-D-glutamyl-L-lysine dipeptidyl-peptidase